ncbi:MULTISPECIES: NUDIX domain-containing protein [unclassified Streptomyces]|uniref:NUDIX domain-containing protein n=1 Tax=unclassified Streptomyces TaxID=2593676 RepID=UPI0033B4FAB1
MKPRPGVDVPDRRGRTGLDRAGRDLDRDPDVVVRDVRLTSEGRHVLRRTSFDRRRRDGRWETQERETCGRGDGALVLPCDTGRGCVLLTRRFRYPAYVNDPPDGMLVEAAAGLLDAEDPSTAVHRESAEEPGAALGRLTHVLDACMGPGSVTERLPFHAAPCGPADRTGAGGGIEEEGEDIEVLELPFAEALVMVRDGRVVDGKTTPLLRWAALEGPFAPRRAWTRARSARRAVPSTRAEV